MTRLALALVLLTACKQAKDLPVASELIATTRALSQKICACRDVACAKPLLAEWNALTTAATGSGQVAGLEITIEQVEALMTEDERVRKCAATLANVR